MHESKAVLMKYCLYCLSFIFERVVWMLAGEECAGYSSELRVVRGSKSDSETDTNNESDTDLLYMRTSRVSFPCS